MYDDIHAMHEDADISIYIVNTRLRLDDKNIINKRNLSAEWPDDRPAIPASSEVLDGSAGPWTIQSSHVAPLESMEQVGKVMKREPKSPKTIKNHPKSALFPCFSLIFGSESGFLAA